MRFGGPGDWVVEVAARVQGVGIVQGSARFQVSEAPRIPGIGEMAPLTDNPVIGDPAVDPVAIDSRAHGGRDIPDPELHHVSIADAIADRQITLVVFSTPVYCVSRFCGPVADMIDDLAKRYRGEADFIHVEVWKDFQANIANDAANRWLNRDGTLTEPWLFMIGRDGRIEARGDNLFTEDEVASALTESLSAA